MIKKILLVCLTLPVFSAFAQKRIDSLQVDSLRDMEIQLQGLSQEFVNSPDERTRVSSAYYFVKTMARAMRTRGSYEYRFDSIKSVSVLPAPDNFFRIFTWHLRLDNGVYRQYGVLQMNPDKYPGKGMEERDDLRMYYPLIDRSDSVLHPADTLLGPEFWFGALYYSIIQRKVGKQSYYFLFGYDGNGKLGDKKLVDVLTFTDGKPQFGAPMFQVKGKVKSRFIIVYNQDASVSIRYLPKDNIITYDHLMSPSMKDFQVPELYIPDGTYDYMEWKDNKWIEHELLFDKKKLKTKE